MAPALIWAFSADILAHIIENFSLTYWTGFGKDLCIKCYELNISLMFSFGPFLVAKVLFLIGLRVRNYAWTDLILPSGTKGIENIVAAFEFLDHICSLFCLILVFRHKLFPIVVADGTWNFEILDVHSIC